MRLSILIPTFNEERTVERLIRRILAAKIPIAYELILIDDHSTDHTYAIEQQLRDTIDQIPIKLLRNWTNRGKGACIRQGLKHATGDLVLVQDGDLEYKPTDIPRLLQPILDGRAEVVYGSRFKRRWWPSGMTLPSYAANRLLTWLTNLLYGLRLTDMEVCYKVIPRKRLIGLRLQATQFAFEPEVTAKLAKCGAGFYEVPISYHGRTSREGKKIRAKDFFAAVWMLLRCRVT